MILLLSSLGTTTLSEVTKSSQPIDLYIDPIEELYDMYSEEEYTPRIVEVTENKLGLELDLVSESQLLFISIRQRELVRVLTSLVCLLIHNSLGLCTNYPALPTKLCVTCDCDVTLSRTMSHSVTEFPTL